MGRTSCCSKGGLHKGPWTAREDALLVNFIQEHGEGHWRALPKKAGLLRCGKSCRLRWMNYLRPDIKRGNITTDEDDLIIKLHSLLGNRWSLIAGRLPGRTDNEIKNYWNSHLSKRLAVTSDQNTETQKVEIALNSENGETSKTRSPTRASPFSGQRDDDNSSSGMASGLPLSPARPEAGSEGGAEAEAELAAPSWCNMSGEEIQNSKGGVEVEESGHLFYGFEVFCEGSWSSPVNGDMIDEVEDDSYQQLLNLEGEDYIQLESFIDYFLI